MNEYTALGVMSGSSLDGIDLAYCSFRKIGFQWAFEIIHAETIPYTEEWEILLSDIPGKSAADLVELDISYGILITEMVNRFLDKYQIEPQLIASHGHTIFHEPVKGFTFQLGNGQTIAQFSGLKTITDFRLKDIQLGGQGAPLVPIGDQLLFAEYDFCLNIGGIANISYRVDDKRIALDICPANQLLNYLSRQLGKPYDNKGQTASLGRLDVALFGILNDDPYFKKSAPKSLSNSYVQDVFFKILDTSDATIEDKLYTVVKHIAFQVNEVIKNVTGSKILISGGGAHNRFLTDAISMETAKEIIIPSQEIIDFKEALVFALMGILRNLNEVNCLSTATGARSDSCSGVIHLP